MANRHGITYTDTAAIFGVSEGVVRQWFYRYPALKAARTQDGRIDPIILGRWYDNTRNQHQAGRRGTKGEPAKPTTLPRVASGLLGVTNLRYPRAENQLATISRGNP